MNIVTLTTPAGPLTIVADDAGLVHAAGFTGEPEQLPLPPGATVPRPRAELGAVSRAVAAYLEGDLDAVGQVPVAPPGAGGFVDTAWRALRSIPPGEPWTYRRLAAAAGRPAAARAAGSACARNPAALFVPCHRVVPSSGGVGDFRWGAAVKRWLLAHERRHAGAPA